jgi:superfamily II DNA/RNA helicase
MEHHVLVIHSGDKDLITTQIAARNEKTILFIKTQRGAGRLADNLAKAGVLVGALHSGKSQAVRTRTLKLFKNKKTQRSFQPPPPAVSTSMASSSLCTSIH